MEFLNTIIKKIFIFEKEPQKVGLSQLKQEINDGETEKYSIKRKDVRLSDLMRRAG